MQKTFNTKINEIIQAVEFSDLMFRFRDIMTCYQVDFEFALNSLLYWGDPNNGRENSAADKAAMNDLINLMHQLADKYYISYFQVVDIICHEIQSRCDLNDDFELSFVDSNIADFKRIVGA